MKTRKRDEQKGSALLVSLMVMVGLSLLGLGFVAISETESAIAVNERNATQALAAAEAGALMVVEWFQDADWADQHGLLPPNVNALKTPRVLAAGTNYYKQNAGELLFDTPFKLLANNQFFGDEDHADVIIDTSTTAGADFLVILNASLFSDDSVRISEIRVYAPPMPNATLTGGFWEGATRYGVATISVVAEKMAGDRVVARRRVKAVVAETPFPTVDGAIETAGSLVGQGNFAVYWGKVLSEKSMQLSRPAAGMPWLDARQVMPFEIGYDSVPEWKPSTVYALGDVVQATGSAIAADGDLTKFAFKCTGIGVSHTTEPAWVKTGVGAVTTETTLVKWEAVVARPYQYNSGDFYGQHNWLAQIYGRSIADPWLHARARGGIGLTNNGKPPCGDAVAAHPCKYNAVSDLISSRMSNIFQHQTITETVPKPDKIEVVFPTMDYEFWKAVAQSGSNDPGSGVYYFRYDKDNSTQAAPKFIGPGGKSDDLIDWLNAKKNGLGPGFYFFDTKDGKNPQYGKGGTLVDSTVSIGSAVGAGWQMQGYVYLNVDFFGSSGTGALDKDNADVYNMPGEPYRDIGYRRVDPDTDDYAIVGGAPLPAGGFEIVGASNTLWDFQDLNENGVFDYHVEASGAAIKRPDGSDIAAGEYFLVPWSKGCTVPDLQDMTAKVAGNCSEPHEPYLNLLYPPADSPKDGVTVQWHDPSDGAPSRRPKLRVAKNAGVECTDESQLSDCTSNGYDVDGALVSIPPILWGALYNEGGYKGSGNATYYGALLMRGDFDSSGTPDVFFNECLARGCLEDQLKMQRVMISAWETDK